MANFLRDELTWASGLFEGEGCITQSATNKGKLRRYPRLVLASTDEDVVRRFHAAVGGLGNVYGRYYQPAYWKKKGLPGKGQWVWQLTGFHKSQAIIAMLWDGLSARRKARAREVMRYR